MDNIEQRLFENAVVIPELLIPAKNIAIKTWATIACDQWTQDRDYWKQVEQIAGDKPSTLNMIFPEVYLNDQGKEDRIKRIHSTMNAYLAKEFGPEAVFNKARRAGAFVERRCLHGIRQGLIIAIDLEQYDWRTGSKALIRSTEGTIKERIPPRVEVRRGAPLELPHILLLINDKENILMSLLAKLMHTAPFAYDSDLMLESGHVRGRLLYRKNDWNFIADAFDHLRRLSCTQYDNKNPFLFAVGDGNHSLATAKAAWDEYKAAHASDPNIAKHPARFALVEIVNLYDPALTFEPIHRIVFGAGFDAAFAALKTLPAFSSRECRSREELSGLVKESGINKNRCGLCCGGKFVLAEYAEKKAAAVDLEPILDKLSSPPASIDYIHGEDELFRLVETDGRNAAGILMPPFSKELLFPTVAASGALPRKTFSMGEPCEKRFYLECRKIF